MKETVLDALATVEQCIEEAKKLDNAAVGLFKDQTSELFNIAGPQWATFVQDKANLISQMNELQEKYEMVNRELSLKKGRYILYLENNRKIRGFQLR